MEKKPIVRVQILDLVPISNFLSVKAYEYRSRPWPKPMPRIEPMPLSPH